jgi:peptidoglycan/LPS O-acetylase OafA/YrhL
MSTLSLDYKKNALNTLKTLAAIQVAYLHIINHLEIAVPNLVTSIFGVFMGVPIFFILSGYLIWTSIGRSPNFVEYTKRRAVRIFPELWIGVAIEIFVILVFLKEKINWVLLAAFTFCQSTFMQFWTPDFLRSFGCGTPNGALWTMGLTIQFYFVVWFVYKVMHKKNLYWWGAAIVSSIAIKAVSPTISSALPGVVGKLYGQTLLPYLWMFLFGCFLSEYKEKIIPLLKKYWYIPFLCSFIFSITKFDIGFAGYGVFTYILRVSGLIGLSYTLPKLNVKIDISYGLFIYHMIVVNIMIELGFVGQIHHLFIALLASGALAIGSTYAGKFIASKLNKEK